MAAAGVVLSKLKVGNLESELALELMWQKIPVYKRTSTSCGFSLYTSSVIGVFDGLLECRSLGSRKTSMNVHSLWFLQCGVQQNREQHPRPNLPSRQLYWESGAITMLLVDWYFKRFCLGRMVYLNVWMLAYVLAATTKIHKVHRYKLRCRLSMTMETQLDYTWSRCLIQP